MANINTAFVDGFNRENGEQDGAITFEEALVHVNGLKLNGPIPKPLKSDRAPGDVNIGDLPLRDMSDTGGKIEQFLDVNLTVVLDPTQAFWDNTIYRLCCQAKYSELPSPFCLAKEPNCPYSLQIIMIPSTIPPDQERKYYNVVKHVCLHKNKVWSKDCMTFCQGSPLCINWGPQPRNGLMALNHMFDRMGGMQIRIWSISAKYEKKLTLDQSAREEGYRFIRDFGPRANNRNQFMEWADEQVHMPGGKLEGWNEGKVREALNNYYRGRQNAKTLEYWPFTLKSFVPWFLHDILIKMLPTMRQHGITWIGKTRAGKSLGSKTVLFAQSRFEIESAAREDLVPSIVTAKHLDFFKAEPISKFKPGVFDDGLLQKMDASFLKAFLNPGAPRLH